MLAAFACGGPRPNARCEDGCPKGRVCDSATQLCVANKPPVVELKSPRDGDRLSGQKATLRGTLSDDEPIEQLQVSLDGANWQIFELQAGSFELQVDLPALDSKPLAFFLQATDLQGETSEARANVTVDNVAPACTGGPAEGQLLGLALAAGFLLEFEATDGSGKVESALISVDGGGSFQPALIEGSKLRWVWALPTENGVTHEIVLRAADPAKNTCEVRVKVKVDTVAPTCGPAVPIEGQLLGSASASGFTIEFNAQDGDLPLASARISADGRGSFQPAAIGAGKISLAWPLPAENGVAHLLVAQVEDQAGNGCETSLTATVDTVPPTLGIASPAEGAIIGPAALSSLAWSGAASDGDRPAPRVTLDFDDGTGPRAASVASGSWDVTVPLSAADDYRSHTVSVQVKDAAENVATLSRTVYVDRKAPVLAITAPSEGAKLNIADVGASGNVNLAWTASDGDPQSVAKYQLGGAGPWVTVTQSPLPVGTSPTDNPGSYSVAVKVTDRAGNETSATRAFQVDRVAPTAISTLPPDGSRMNLPAVSVSLSEMVSQVATPLVLNPAPTGALQSNPPSFSYSGLAGGTAFVATVPAGAVKDSFDNPNPAASWKFHVAPLPPVNGVLVTGVGSCSEPLRVAFDGDGQVNLAVKDGTCSGLAWWEISPATGAANLLSQSNQKPSSFSVAAWRSIKADLAPGRVQGTSHSYISGIPPYPTFWLAGWRIDGVSATGPVGAVPLPMPPGCAEPAGLSEVGALRQVGTAGEYFRSGMASATPIGIKPMYLIAPHPDFWEATELTPPNIKVVVQQCRCDRFGNGCSIGAPSTVYSDASSSADLSVAATATGGRLLHVYNDASGSRTEACRVHLEGVCPLPCGLPPDGSQTSPTAERLRVASGNQREKLIGARVRAGAIEVVERDLTSSCTGSWTLLGTAPAGSGSSSAFEPVMFGRKPGVLYLEGGSIKAYVTP